ncbi:glycosyltransferase family protein [Leucobacter soli]|uniref:hypothetical protein n=1 Tax=Leucobacter soli TaxID=2812850 RepID=UPI00360FEAFA
MMYRAAAVEGVGGYQRFGKMEDYWLGVRMIAGGARVENIAEPLLRYRVGAGAFARRGGWTEARTEWRLQGELRRMGFVTTGQYLRNVVVKGPTGSCRRGRSGSSSAVSWPGAPRR